MTVTIDPQEILGNPWVWLAYFAASYLVVIPWYCRRIYRRAKKVAEAEGFSGSLKLMDVEMTIPILWMFSPLSVFLIPLFWVVRPIALLAASCVSRLVYGEW